MQFNLNEHFSFPIFYTRCTLSNSFGSITNPETSILVNANDTYHEHLKATEFVQLSSIGTHAPVLLFCSSKRQKKLLKASEIAGAMIGAHFGHSWS